MTEIKKTKTFCPRSSKRKNRNRMHEKDKERQGQLKRPAMSNDNQGTYVQREVRKKAWQKQVSVIR